MCFKETGKEHQWRESPGAASSPSRTGSEWGSSHGSDAGSPGDGSIRSKLLCGNRIPLASSVRELVLFGFCFQRCSFNLIPLLPTWRAPKGWFC